jgi:light-regulated signal transduction histidine kinase (bacteriophytochrome)
MQLLKDAIKTTDPKIQNYLQKINISTKGMSVMIDELLKFSHLGRAELHYKETDLNKITTEIIEQFKPDYANRTICWEVENIPLVKGDPALLKVVLENLISNAIKYTSKKEQAIIEIREYKSDENFVTFIVKDNGAGFDEAYKEKLFGVFQRLHTKEEFDGIGIGLANVKQIITKHNGTIDATSEVDKGATFYITLPK